jgi:hypothetical protein
MLCAGNIFERVSNMLLPLYDILEKVSKKYFLPTTVWKGWAKVTFLCIIVKTLLM